LASDGLDSGKRLNGDNDLSRAFKHDIHIEPAARLGWGRRFFGDERGSNLLEYGVILTLFLTMLFGVIDFGRALYAYHFVADAAREGTRYAIVRGSTCPLSECPSGPASTMDIQNYIKNVPSGIDPAQLTVTPLWNPSGSATCNGTPNAPGCVVEVQVSYNFSFMLPFMPQSSVVMTSSSQMIISQ
jgi:Flp pilus assembly protein TadG